MDTSEIQAAFDDVYDQALVFHGFADYMRDYDVFVHVQTDPRSGIASGHLRYRFTYCVRATVATAIGPAGWRVSLDERLVDYEQYLQGREQDRDLDDGFVWGVKCGELYPEGMQLVTDSAEAERWSGELGLPFHEAVIQTNAHYLSLVFSDLVVQTVDAGYAPFVVSDGGSNDKGLMP